MIRHIVFFTAKPENIDAVHDGLQALATIPYAQRFEVTRNSKVDLYANEVDVVVYAEFEDRAALDAYKAHPTYEATTAKVKPLRELRFAADVPAVET